MTYVIETEAYTVSIRCLLCGWVSCRVEDVHFLYCGKCKIFHKDHMPDILDKLFARMGHYTLDENDLPVLCGNRQQWSDWMQTANIHFGDTQIGEVRVSTVFLGINHDWLRKGKPVLFETLVFGGELNDTRWSYTSAVDAEFGHAAMVKLVEGRGG